MENSIKNFHFVFRITPYISRTFLFHDGANNRYISSLFCLSLDKIGLFMHNFSVFSTEMDSFSCIFSHQ